MRRDISGEELRSIGISDDWNLVYDATGTQAELRWMGDWDGRKAGITYALLKRLSGLFQTTHIDIVSELHGPYSEVTPDVDLDVSIVMREAP